METGFENRGLAKLATVAEEAGDDDARLDDAGREVLVPGVLLGCKARLLVGQPKAFSWSVC